jgi:hypothetical protein
MLNCLNLMSLGMCGTFLAICNTLINMSVGPGLQDVIVVQLCWGWGERPAEVQHCRGADAG